MDDDLPNPNTAERNQQRKLAFIPMWPIVGAIVVVVVLVLLLH
jgi:type VI protein secretion system component VasF